MTDIQNRKHSSILILASLVTAALLTVLVSPFSFGACPKLPQPSGNTITVDTVEEIWNAVNSAAPGDMILVADGKYNLGATGRYIWINVAGITIRSQSGDRESVIFDDQYQG
jgi:hypothetical protein